MIPPEAWTPPPGSAPRPLNEWIVEWGEWLLPGLPPGVAAEVADDLEHGLETKFGIGLDDLVYVTVQTRTTDPTRQQSMVILAALVTDPQVQEAATFAEMTRELQ